MPVRLVLARFDAVLARGLTGLLLEDERFRVVARDVAESELEDALMQWKPRVAIVEENVELALLERLQRVQSETELIVVAHNPSSVFALRLLGAGASCLPLSASEAHLRALVLRVAQGFRLFVAANGEWVERNNLAGGQLLTKREWDVLAGIASKLSYPQIARELRIGVRTVETYATTLKWKFGVQTRRELAELVLHRLPS